MERCSPLSPAGFRCCGLQPVTFHVTELLDTSACHRCAPGMQRNTYVTTPPMLLCCCVALPPYPQGCQTVGHSVPVWCGGCVAAAPLQHRHAAVRSHSHPGGGHCVSHTGRDGRAGPGPLPGCGSRGQQHWHSERGVVSAQGYTAALSALGLRTRNGWLVWKQQAVVSCGCNRLFDERIRCTLLCVLHGPQGTP